MIKVVDRSDVAYLSRSYDEKYAYECLTAEHYRQRAAHIAGESNTLCIPLVFCRRSFDANSERTIRCLSFFVDTNIYIKFFFSWLKISWSACSAVWVCGRDIAVLLASLRISTMEKVEKNCDEWTKRGIASRNSYLWYHWSFTFNNNKYASTFTTTRLFLRLSISASVCAHGKH